MRVHGPIVRLITKLILKGQYVVSVGVCRLEWNIEFGIIQVSC